jgi:hypothetical protein
MDAMLGANVGAFWGQKSFDSVRGLHTVEHHTLGIVPYGASSAHNHAH